MKKKVFRARRGRTKFCRAKFYLKKKGTQKADKTANILNMKRCHLMTFLTTVVSLNPSSGEKITQAEKLISEQVWFSEDAWATSEVNVEQPVFDVHQAKQAAEFVWFSEDLPYLTTIGIETTTRTTTTPPPPRPVFSRFSAYSDLPLFYTYEKNLAVKLDGRRK